MLIINFYSLTAFAFPSDLGAPLLDVMIVDEQGNFLHAFTTASITHIAQAMTGLVNLTRENY